MYHIQYHLTRPFWVHCGVLVNTIGNEANLFTRLEPDRYSVSQFADI